MVGGGASGLLAAGIAAREGNRVTLAERNPRPARKLMITGKGRCNVTNHCGLNGLIASVPRNGRFLYSAFSAFSPEDTMEFFESRRVPLKVERGNRVFPKSDKASDIVDALVHFARSSGVKLTHSRVTGLQISDSRVTGAICEDGASFPADRIILATGGLSYPLTGSTGDGYRLAEQAGHTVIEPSPSLIPMLAHEGWCSDLQGLSLRNIAVKGIDIRKNKVIYSDFGELLFTHYGLSGPLILSASAHMRKPEDNQYRIEIDLKPALDEKQLDARVLRDFEKYANRDFQNALDDLLPRKLIPVVVRLSGIAPSAKIHQITKEQRLELVRLLKCLRLHITGFRPVEEAVITSGGVSVKEIDPKTMASKRCGGLYFAGEVIDVDAYTGGFNLQIAFSTGYLAGKSVS